MNGPFFNERGMFLRLLAHPALLLVHSSTRRSFTHWARRSLRNPRTGPATRCERGQNGHTKRVPCALGIRSTITAHPFRHKRNKTWGAGANFDPALATGLATGLAAGLFTRRAATAFRELALRGFAFRRGADVRVALITALSSPPRRDHFLY